MNQGKHPCSTQMKTRKKIKSESKPEYRNLYEKRRRDGEDEKKEIVWLLEKCWMKGWNEE